MFVYAAAPSNAKDTTTMKIKMTGLACGLAMLVLAGCSDSVSESASSPSSPSESTAGVYQFKTPAYGSKDELRIELPKDLTESVPEGKDLLVTSVTATARELSSLEYCAVDYVMTYADGALEELKKPQMTHEEWEEMNREELEEIVRFEMGAATVEEYRADYQSSNGIPPSESDVASFETRLADFTTRYIAAGGLGEYEETTEKENVAKSLTDAMSVFSIDDLESSDPVSGRYISDDLKTLTSVQSCAEAPKDDWSAKNFVFPYIGEASKPTTFAEVDVNVMRDGSLTVVKSYIASYMLDANGSWLVK